MQLAAELLDGQRRKQSSTTSSAASDRQPRQKLRGLRRSDAEDITEAEAAK
jgi:hypothetical protein